MDGVSIPVYPSKTASIEQSSEQLFTVKDWNPYTAFFTENDANKMGMSVMTPYNGRLHQAYLNNLNQDFQKVILVDYRQFLNYVELIQKNYLCWSYCLIV